MNTEELRRLLKEATPTPWERNGNAIWQVGEAGENVLGSVPRGGTRISDEDMDLIVAAVNALPSLLDEIDRLRRRAKSDSDGLNRWCDYQDRLFAVMTSDEIRAFDARLTEGGWSNEPLCRHEAEVAALRRQIEAVEAERDAQLQRAARWQHVAAEALRATYCDAATPEAMAENVVRAINSAQRAALSSVPDSTEPIYAPEDYGRGRYNPPTAVLERVLAKHQLATVLPGGVLCTCGAELAALNPPLDDGAVKGEPLALAAHQLQELEADR